MRRASSSIVEGSLVTAHHRTARAPVLRWAGMPTAKKRAPSSSPRRRVAPRASGLAVPPDATVAALREEVAALTRAVAAQTEAIARMGGRTVATAGIPVDVVARLGQSADLLSATAADLPRADDF